MKLDQVLFMLQSVTEEFYQMTKFALDIHVDNYQKGFC